MSNPVELNEYKQQIAALYSQRSYDYDQGDWHPRIAHRLVEHAQIRSGQKILDIATGTGLVAIEVAQLVGPRGQVVGVDIAKGMLRQAKRKIAAAGLDNIELQLVDAEALNFPDNSFDTILCSSALIWMVNIPASLRLWHRLLKPGGRLGFHGFADTAFIGGVVMKKVVKRYGVTLTFNEITGTAQKCHDLLQQAGFEDIKISTEQFGSYLSLEQAKRLWYGSSKNPTPGQVKNPLAQLTAEQLRRVKAEYEAELEALVTDQGIWNDILIFFPLGRKGSGN